MKYEEFARFNADPGHSAVPKAIRLMRVLIESVREMVCLSQFDALITQGSSHFSTLALALLWARTGSDRVLQRSVLLDAPEIEEGIAPTAFVEGTQFKLFPNETGADRWQIHTSRFVSGLAHPSVLDQFAPAASPLAPSPWTAAGRMRWVDLLPWLPPTVFQREATRWLPSASASATAESAWPGTCPLLRQVPAHVPIAHALTALIQVGGAHQREFHMAEARFCFGQAVVLGRQAREHAAATELPSLDNLAQVAQHHFTALSAPARIYAELVGPDGSVRLFVRPPGEDADLQFIRTYGPKTGPKTDL